MCSDIAESARTVHKRDALTIESREPTTRRCALIKCRDQHFVTERQARPFKLSISRTFSEKLESS